MVQLKNLAVAAAALFGTSLSIPLAARDETVELFRDAKAGDVVPNSYIVKLKSGLEARDLESHLNWVNAVHKKRDLGTQYRGVERKFSNKYQFNAYSGHFDEETLKEIKNSPEVEFVEEDKVWVIDYEVSKEEKRDLVTQESATWGLGTVSHREPGHEDYIYEETAGTGTYAYIVDTGILATHSEFGGRASLGWTGFPGQEADTEGHGTHVAGTVAGTTYGVAKEATIIAVKVFLGSSSTTAIILEGFDWAVTDILDQGREDVSVINLSLGGGFSAAFNAAIDNASASGVISVVAAGNSAIDAGQTSPASAETAITVGAINSAWSITSFSNYGTVLDIFAPGQDVLSSYIGSDTATASASGTSMSSPHVAGLVLYVNSVYGVSGPAEVVSYLQEIATADAITGNLGGSPNLIGNNGNDLQ